MRRWIVLVGSLTLMAGGTQGALAQDPPNDTDRVQSLVQPSIVFLQTTYSAVVRDVNPRYAGTKFGGVRFGGDAVSAAGRCTGFFVNPDGYVATAAHCLLPGDTQRGWIIDAAAVREYEAGAFTDATTLEDAVAYGRKWYRLGRVSTSYLVGYPTTSTSISSEETTAARRVGYRVFEEGDIGLLKFEAGGTDFPGLELAPDDVEVRVGTAVIAVGFPGSVEEVTDDDYNPTFTGGDITRIGTTGGRSVAVYQHDAAVSGGMSGGPVVDTDGRVIGVTSFGIVGETEAFNFATPVAILREVLNDKGVENDVGNVGRTYREGVEALYDRKRSTALDRFDEVATNAGNPAVALVNGSLRQRAQELPEEEGFPLWAWVLIGLGAVAFVTVAAAVAISRSRGTPRKPATTPVFAGVPASTAPPPLRTETPRASLPPPPSSRAAKTTVGDAGPAVLVVGSRGDTATRHQLEGEMIVGREAADILLPDEQVSRRHAALSVRDDGRVEVSDLGSANGTEVNGKRITARVELAHGDTIRVGSTDLKVELPRGERGSAPSGATVIAPRGDA